MTNVDYGLFDADQHYYEAEDAFTRYASERMRREKYIRWSLNSTASASGCFAAGVRSMLSAIRLSIRLPGRASISRH